MIGPTLVILAITHEMGHSICQDRDERRADDYGKELRDGRLPDCSKTPGRKSGSVAKIVAVATTSGASQ